MIQCDPFWETEQHFNDNAVYQELGWGPPMVDEELTVFCAFRQ